MALFPAAAAGVGAAAVTYKVSTGKPEPRRIDTGSSAIKPAYWRNWVGNTMFDVYEDAYRQHDMSKIQTSYPRQLPEGNWLPPDNGTSSVNPAIGTIVRDTGRTWRHIQLSAPSDSHPSHTRANRAPLPPKQRSMITM